MSSVVEHCDPCLRNCTSGPSLLSRTFKILNRMIPNEFVCLLVGWFVFLLCILFAVCLSVSTAQASTHLEEDPNRGVPFTLQVPNPIAITELQSLKTLSLCSSSSTGKQSQERREHEFCAVVALRATLHIPAPTPAAACLAEAMISPPLGETICLDPPGKLQRHLCGTSLFQNLYSNPGLSPWEK